MTDTGADISVVVQGPVLGAASEPANRRFTQRALDSARQTLSRAEIILSTWKGSDLDGLRADVVLENEDPGAVRYAGSDRVNNVNRQIVSSLAGVKAAARPFVLKIRSDMLVDGAGFRRFFGKYERRCASQAVDHRIVASTIASPVPLDAFRHCCYWPSDWFQFGTRRDVLALWDIALAPEPETTLWFTTHAFPAGVGAPAAKIRYAIEQYLWVTFLRKHHPVQFDSLWDVAPETIRASERSLAANLVLISPRQANLRPLKYPEAGDSGLIDHIRKGYYTHPHWRHLYETHCGGRALHAAAWYPPFRGTLKLAQRTYAGLKRAAAA